MRFTTVLTLGTLVLVAGCEKAKEPVAADPSPAPAAQQAPAPVARPSQPIQAPTRVPQAEPQAPVYEAADRAVPQQPVYSDYRPPLAQPRPIAAPWAPPPLLGEAVPPQPSLDATWTGGYWVWREQWVWAPGHWARPPRPDYRWVPPYYEHRDDRVLFVDGFWSAPGVAFIRPAATLSIALAVVGAGIAIGRPPVGPEGPFVPPPPGSRWGLIVPAPVGTSPSVMRDAPAIIAPGMRVTNNITRVSNDSHDTTINNRNTTVVNNVTNNVTIEAPASATSNHQAIHAVVAPESHLVAGAPAVAAPINPGPAIAPPRPTPAQPGPSARDRGIAGREAQPRSPDIAKPAAHPEVQAVTPRQPDRASERPADAARSNDRAMSPGAPKPKPTPQAAPERPKAQAESRPQAPPAKNAPASKPEPAHPPQPHEVRTAEAPHPQPHAVPPPPKEKAAVPKAAAHDPKQAEKDRAHEKPKAERRD